MNTESQTDRITQLESSCAAMRSVLMACDNYLAGASQPTNRAIIKQALSTDSGKALLDRLQKAEGEVEKWQGEFDTVRDLLHQSQDRRQAVEAERDRAIELLRDIREQLEKMTADRDAVLQELQLTKLSLDHTQDVVQRLQAVEAEREHFKNCTLELGRQFASVKEERDRYKAALDKIGRIGKTVGFSRAACSSVAMEALQPAQKDAPEKGTK